MVSDAYDRRARVLVQPASSGAGAAKTAAPASSTLQQQLAPPTSSDGGHQLYGSGDPATAARPVQVRRLSGAAASLDVRDAAVSCQQTSLQMPPWQQQQQQTPVPMETTVTAAALGATALPGAVLDAAADGAWPSAASNRCTLQPSSCWTVAAIEPATSSIPELPSSDGCCSGHMQQTLRGASSLQPATELLQGGSSSSSSNSSSSNALSATGPRSRLGRLAVVCPAAPAGSDSALQGTPFAAASPAAAHLPAFSSGGMLSGLDRGSSSGQLLACTGWQLSLHCVTFNMAGQLPGCQQLPLAMLGLDLPQLPDLLAVATQESCSITDWEALLACMLLPRGYRRVAGHSLRAIHLVLFAQEHAAHHVLGVRCSAVATGIGNLVGNKGGVALSVALPGVKLLLVGSHFAAHDDQVERRNADFHRIRTSLFSSSSSSLQDLARASSGSGGSSSACSTPAAGSGLELRSFGWLSAGRPARPGQLSGCGGSCSGGADSKARSASASPRDCWLGASRQQPDAHGTVALLSVASDAADCSLAAELLERRAASCPPPAMAATARAQQVEGCCQPAAAPAAARDDRRSSSGAAGQPCVPEQEVRSQLSMFKSFTTLGRPSLSARSAASSGGGAGPDAVASHDVVVWAGDLNYRINGNARALHYLMRTRLREVMHANDQLQLQQRKGRAFQGFQEGKIHFAPTFKFKLGTSEYSQARVPSWTDRILWRVCRTDSSRSGCSTADDGSCCQPAVSVAQSYYTSLPEVTSSDHKPVVAGFQLQLAPAAAAACADALQAATARSAHGGSADPGPPAADDGAVQDVPVWRPHIRCSMM